LKRLILKLMVSVVLMLFLLSGAIATTIKDELKKCIENYGHLYGAPQFLHNVYDVELDSSNGTYEIPSYWTDINLQYQSSMFWNGMLDVVVVGTYAYCAMYPGLVIFDVSDPTNPIPVDSVYLPDGWPTDLTVVGDYVYMTEWGSTSHGVLYVIEIPTKKVYSYQTPRSAYGVDVGGDTAYVVYGLYGEEQGLLRLDMSDLSKITLIDELPSEYPPLKILVRDSVAYIAGGGYLWTVDISASPCSTVSQAMTEYYPVDLVGDSLGGSIYVAEQDFMFPPVTSAVSVYSTDSLIPELAARKTLPGSVSDVAVMNDMLYVANGERGIRLLQLGDSLTLLSTYAVSGYAGRIFAQGNTVYVADFGPQPDEKGSGLREARIIGTPLPGDFQIVNVADSISPELYGFYGFTGSVTNLARSGNYIFTLNNKSNGSALVMAANMYDPDQPVIVDSLLVNGVLNNATVVGDSLLILATGTDIRILDISNPAAMVQVNEYTTLSSALEVAVYSHYAIVAVGSDGVQVFNLHDPTDMPVVSFSSVNMVALSVETYGNILYVADRTTGIQVYDITDLGNPEYLTTVNHNQALYNGLEVSSTYLYATTPSGFQILNLGIDSTNPDYVSGYSEAMWCNGFTIVSHYVLLADGWDGIRIINVSDPLQLYQEGWHNTPGFSYDLVVDSQHAYVADSFCMIVLEHPILLDVDEQELIMPHRYELKQNFPNPFNPSTIIEFVIPRRSHVVLDVFDVLGRRIETVVDLVMPAGSHSVEWDGCTFAGERMASGVYFYRLTVGGAHSQARKMVLVK